MLLLFAPCGDTIVVMVALTKDNKHQGRRRGGGVEDVSVMVECFREDTRTN